MQIPRIVFSVLFALPLLGAKEVKEWKPRGILSVDGPSGIACRIKCFTKHNTFTEVVRDIPAKEILYSPSDYEYCEVQILDMPMSKKPVLVSYIREQKNEDGFIESIKVLKEEQMEAQLMSLKRFKLSVY